MNPRSCNILGPTALGFRHRDDLAEITGCWQRLGIAVNVVAPLDATPADIRRIPEAAFNVVLYPEMAETAGRWLERNFKQPMTTIVPIGVRATRDFIAQVAQLAGLDADAAARRRRVARLPWYSRSVDFDLSHRQARLHLRRCHAMRWPPPGSPRKNWASRSSGSAPIPANSPARCARLPTKLGLEALITDDYLEVEAKVAELQPELVLGTQMERHIAKRLGVPCAVISAPVHVQDFPARYSPQMGFEGANVIFDSWVHPLMMGLEEHLLHMFRDDFEFNDKAAASHLGHGASKPAAPGCSRSSTRSRAAGRREAETELQKIPFFVRGKARRNTERFAAERGITLITIETLYDAKAHYSR